LRFSHRSNLPTIVRIGPVFRIDAAVYGHIVVLVAA
jgi:hypothetical protein